MSTKTTRKPTTEVTHSEEFITLAKEQPREALVYMFVTAFGFTLLQALQNVRSVIIKEDVQMAALMLTAAVQIRGNVVFVGDGYASARTTYPQLIIKGRKEVNDIFNFGALHICGHVLCTIGSRTKGEDWYENALTKAGSCIAGRDADYPDNEAGRINKEIRDGWSKSQMTSFDDAAVDIYEAEGVADWLHTLHQSIEPLFTAFAAQLARAQGAQ